LRGCQLKYKPLVLCVLDGWGCRDEVHGNAIAAAALPNWNGFFARYPWTTLQASGETVGLPKGIMGNSEVGHTNMGSGRIVPQGVTIIDEDIRSGNFANNATLKACIDHVKRTGGTLHLMGLVSDGKVHSSLDHLFALIDAATKAGVPLAIHAFLDGRDTPPRSAQSFLNHLQEKLYAAGLPDAIKTVTGRYYAMDRDNRWERTDAAFDAIAKAQGEYDAATPQEALLAGYARGEDDEFVKPATVAGGLPVRDGDACIFFNFRPDRARQLTVAFNRFGLADFIFATMTKYDETFENAVLFGPRPQFDTFGEIVSREGLRQLRLAETEKYAHVTYFFNGGREEVFHNEDRKLIPSDRSVPTYDLAPSMRAREITDYAVECVRAATYDVIVMNYANADMVGHTGKWQPSIEAIELLDHCLGRLAKAVLAAGGLLAITADHGNAEDKIDPRGNPLTAHTTNPVPFVLIAKDFTGKLRSGGKLGDVAPTLLRLEGLPVPAAMTGDDLLRSFDTSG
jgi:2,3-bisphosphoglycerate-independent phosphoglycerate mutase